MKLQPLGSNQTELQLNDYYVLFSYKTPVAAIDRSTGKAYKTAKKWSVTTSRHVNRYFKDTLGAPENATVEERPQEFFDNLVK